MPIPTVLRSLAIAACVAAAGIPAARADDTPGGRAAPDAEDTPSAPDARTFVQRANDGISALLRQPRSPARAGRIDAAMDGLVDFDALAGAATVGASLSDAQRTEVRDLLRRWIVRRYVGTLARAEGYRVAYVAAAPISPREWRVRTEIRSATDPREPATDVDYIVRRGDASLHVVDIMTEGASLAESCRREFAKLLGDEKAGYAALVQHLRDAALATVAF